MAPVRASIIIAAHNEGDRLAKTLRSCQANTGGIEFEYILVDDASPDDCVDAASDRFPGARVVRQRQRRGTSASKDHGAQLARGGVLVFLDGHTKPERAALRKLVEDVEATRGEAIVQPRIPALDARVWRNSRRSVGYGYHVELQRLETRWVRPDRLWRRGRFFESPCLIGCAFAISRDLYRKLRGFDPHMLQWGAEDIDLGLKSWLLGHPVLVDPSAAIGHVFRRRFDNYLVEPECVAVNKLRIARKNFTESTWRAWLAALRARSAPSKWRKIWRLYREREASAERERRYLDERRVYDEFWFARKFGLSWPERPQRLERPQRPRALRVSRLPSLR